MHIPHAHILKKHAVVRVNVTTLLLCVCSYEVGSFGNVARQGGTVTIQSTAPIIGSHAAQSGETGTPAFTGNSDYFVLVPAAPLIIGVPSRGFATTLPGGRLTSVACYGRGVQRSSNGAGSYFQIG